MAACLGNAFDQELPDFLAQGGHLVCGEFLISPGALIRSSKG